MKFVFVSSKTCEPNWTPNVNEEMGSEKCAKCENMEHEKRETGMIKHEGVERETSLKA